MIFKSSNTVTMYHRIPNHSVILWCMGARSVLHHFIRAKHQNQFALNSKARSQISWYHLFPPSFLQVCFGYKSHRICGGSRNSCRSGLRVENRLDKETGAVLTRAVHLLAVGGVQRRKSAACKVDRTC